MVCDTTHSTLTFQPNSVATPHPHYIPPPTAHSAQAHGAGCFFAQTLSLQDRCSIPSLLNHAWQTPILTL